MSKLNLFLIELCPSIRTYLVIVRLQPNVHSRRIGTLTLAGTRATLFCLEFSPDLNTKCHVRFKVLHWFATLWVSVGVEWSWSSFYQSVMAHKCSTTLLMIVCSNCKEKDLGGCNLPRQRKLPWEVVTHMYRTNTIENNSPCIMVERGVNGVVKLVRGTRALPLEW